jgi:hypothetical protein
MQFIGTTKDLRICLILPTQGFFAALCMTNGAKSSVFSVPVLPCAMPGIGSRRLWTLRMTVKGTFPHLPGGAK